MNPAPGTHGNLAQTFFTSPNFFNLDAALSKSFRLTGRFSVELRTELAELNESPRLLHRDHRFQH